MNSDPGPDELAAMKSAIDALFYGSVQGNPSAYTLPRQTLYVVYANGAVKPDGEASAICESPSEAIRLTIEAIKRDYPNAAIQTLHWRREPSFERWPARRASRYMDAQKAGFSVSVRIAAEDVAPLMTLPQPVLSSGSIAGANMFETSMAVDVDHMAIHRLDRAAGVIQSALTALHAGDDARPIVEGAIRELQAALNALNQFEDPYADQSLRPGLNKPSEVPADV